MRVLLYSGRAKAKKNPLMGGYKMGPIKDITTLRGWMDRVKADAKTPSRLKGLMRSMEHRGKERPGSRVQPPLHFRQLGLFDCKRVFVSAEHELQQLIV